MDLHQLQAFDQIAQHGSFSKAARRLDISQPTISQRILVLEQEVGGPLFIRGGGHLQLTELGRHFLPHARQALRAMTIGVEMAQQSTQGKRGRIIIGTLPSLATGFFTTTLMRLHRTHPQLDIMVHTGHSQQIAEMLYDNFIQVGFMFSPYFHPGLRNLVTLREPLLLVSGSQHPLAQKARVTLSDLEMLADPYFYIDWNLMTRHWQAQLQVNGGAIIEVPPHTAHELLLQGTGVALMAQSLVWEDLKTGRLTSLSLEEIPMPYRETQLVCLKQAQFETLPAGLVAFLEILREEAGDSVC